MGNSKKNEKFHISGSSTIAELLTVIQTMQKENNEKKCLCAKFQRKGSIDFPNTQPKHLVIIYDEDGVATRFDDYKTAEIYLSTIEENPHRISVDIKYK